MAGNRFIITQLWQNTVCQLFTQLNAPLVKGEDVQDRALREDFVLVKELILLGYVCKRNVCRSQAAVEGECRLRLIALFRE